MKKKALYFNDSKGKLRLLEPRVTKDEAITIINRFCTEREFKIYYYRSWEKDGIVWFDVGSHTEFFHWRPLIVD